jgi:hypothetical protein
VIEVPETGISDRVHAQSVRQFNELTASRLASWFQVFSVTTGIFTVVMTAGSWYLLRNSAPQPEAMQPLAGSPQPGSAASIQLRSASAGAAPT